MYQVPTRVKALPESTRQLLPALAPCAGGAIVLVLISIFVMAEMGIRWMKCGRLCTRCRANFGAAAAASTAVAACACKTSADGSFAYRSKSVDCARVCVG